MIDNYPTWLGACFINKKFPWDEGLKISFQEFEKKYTLHDSCWIGLFYDVGDRASVVIIINWDIVWLPDKIAKDNATVFLLIKIDRVEEISTSRHTSFCYL